MALMKLKLQFVPFKTNLRFQQLIETKFQVSFLAHRPLVCLDGCHSMSIHPPARHDLDIVAECIAF